MALVNGKQILYSLLTSAPIQVITTNVFQSWPTQENFASLPLICFNEVDHYNQDGEWADNKPFADNVNYLINYFSEPNTETHTAASAIDGVLTNAGWTREYSEDLDDPSGLKRRVMRYTKRILK